MPKYVPRVFGGTIIVEDAGQNATGFGGTWRRGGNRGRGRTSGAILLTGSHRGDNNPVVPDLPGNPARHETR